jgi:antirestriction protein
MENKKDEAILKLAEQFSEENNLDSDINYAYIDNIGVEYSKAEDVEEAYTGEYDNDEAFAMDLAEQTGFEQPAVWPYNCIDWEQASRDIMFDYFENNGYYFRNL